ncbi:MAG: fibrobacter succinogenes major paralogous domain-containing protein [Fibrobacter sp.]|nr:fibrobacter succinogenes major paralogous domain-containing protein [Fibrobacter sp.]
MAGTLKDSRDGKTYKTVKIGDQVWMAENLNYKTRESYCYDNKESNCEKYGRLYTWVAAMNACPAGWHLPSEAELERLLAAVGTSGDERSLNLRARSWKNGTDKFGFSALPAGYYSSRREEFCNLGYYTDFWTSTEHNSFYAYRLDISDDFAYDAHNVDKDYGHSVRCLQD